MIHLEIASGEIAVYVADYVDKLVEIHLDYFGRKTIRRLKLYSEDDTIIADLVGQKLSWLVFGKDNNFTEDRDSYQKKN